MSKYLTQKSLLSSLAKKIMPDSQASPIKTRTAGNEFHKIAVRTGITWELSEKIFSDLPAIAIDILLRVIKIVAAIKGASQTDPLLFFGGIRLTFATGPGDKGATLATVRIGRTELPGFAAVVVFPAVHLHCRLFVDGRQIGAPFKQTWQQMSKILQHGMLNIRSSFQVNGCFPVFHG